jgi:hypothetical protein
MLIIIFTTQFFAFVWISISLLAVSLSHSPDNLTDISEVGMLLLFLLLFSFSWIDWCVWHLFHKKYPDYASELLCISKNVIKLESIVLSLLSLVIYLMSVVTDQHVVKSADKFLMLYSFVFPFFLLIIRCFFVDKKTCILLVLAISFIPAGIVFFPLVLWRKSKIASVIYVFLIIAIGIEIIVSIPATTPLSDCETIFL